MELPVTDSRNMIEVVIGTISDAEDLCFKAHFRAKFFLHVSVRSRLFILINDQSVSIL